MASQDAILLNLGMAFVVSLYLFGGETPLVSQTTAVAVGIMQIYSVLTGAIVSGVKPQKKMKVDEEETSDYDASVARQCITCFGMYATEVNLTVRCFAGMIAVLALARFLRTSGFMTTASQAILLALALGVFFSLAAARVWPEESDMEGSNHSAEEHPLGDGKDHYSAAFWSECEPIATTTGPVEEAPLEPSEILTDVLYELYMK